MSKVPKFDMYDFIDDGVHRSFYTILGKYHPNLENDFSLASLINGLPEVGANEGQSAVYTKTYERDVERLIKILQDKTSIPKIFEETEEKVSDKEFDGIFDELKAACADNSDCQFFVTIKEYLDYAKKNISNKESKPLRDAIVKNAVRFMDPKEAESVRALILRTVYLSRAEEEVRKVNHMRREPGQYPEWDQLQFIRSVITKNDGLKEYDEFYAEASANIKAAALKAMEKERIATVCRRKRRIPVKDAINPSISSDAKEAAEIPISGMFDKLKRKPEKGENSWTYESFEEPELLCDMQAIYSQEGMENQRVIAFRYGKLKYQKPSDVGVFHIDNTADMPELIGVSRVGKDGTKTYFVLMKPLNRLTFRPEGEKPTEPGEKPWGFTINKEVKVPTKSGRTVTKQESHPAEIVDQYGTKMNAFCNREIPEEFKEFFAKVFFSDDFLSEAIKNNARYIGAVVDSENGPKIKPSDIGKEHLAAAHYAAIHPGTVDGVRVQSFEKYCSSGSLEMKQYNQINKHEQEKTKSARKPKKDDGAR